MALAIFDLDLTLLSDDSDHQWGEFLVAKNLVDVEQYKQKNDQFYQQYTDGTLDIFEYLEFSLSILTQHPVSTLNAWRDEFVEERIKPLITEKSKALVEQHKAAGDELIIITATSYFVTEPITKLFGIEHLIAPMPELKDGVYTGKVVGTPSFREGKVTCLKQWLKEHPFSLEDAFFYSDSHNDLPLLELVGNPVAVNPDDRLKQIANKNQWPVLNTIE